MAYIGKQPVVGNFVKLDAIVTSATATYNLLNGGVAYFPQTANNCIVSLNGVIQSPISAYTISGSTIVFSDALTSSDTIDFILVLGDVLSIGTPSDNTVSLAKLTATGTPSASTFLRGDNAWSTTGTPTIQTFDTGTGDTWTKPSSANWVQINIWGGGASGGKGASGTPCGGGGGGAYNTLIVPFSYLVGAVTYTVGAGGAGKTVAGVGNAGGTTSVSIADYNGTGVTKTFYAYGGGAGGSNSSGGRGGGGGGYGSAGSSGGTGAYTNRTTNSSVTSNGDGGGGLPSTYFAVSKTVVLGCTNYVYYYGAAPIVNPYGGGFGGGQYLINVGDENPAQSTGTLERSALFDANNFFPIYGGGGGGHAVDGAGTTATDGGSSQYGGGGGGGAANSGTAGVGGTSIYGGNGSNGTVDANNSSAGTVPAGGSGGTEGGDSGAGASGRVQFIYW